MASLMAVKRFIDTVLSLPFPLEEMVVLAFNAGMGLAVAVAADDKDRRPEERKAETSRNWGVSDDAEE
jgi:phosphoribosylaminoimidazole (AIR) synthetase